MCPRLCNHCAALRLRLPLRHTSTTGAARYCDQSESREPKVLKGALIADLPGNYLAWFAREGFPKGEIGRLLALMLEIDHNGLSDLLKPLRAMQKTTR